MNCTGSPWFPWPCKTNQYFIESKGKSIKFYTSEDQLDSNIYIFYLYIRWKVNLCMHIPKFKISYLKYSNGFTEQWEESSGHFKPHVFLTLIVFVSFLNDCNYSVGVCFRLRRFCQRLMSHKVFDHVILFFILLNCVTIAMERPSINPKSMVRPTSGAVTDILTQRSTNI